MVTGLAHLAFTTKDMEATLAFYEKIGVKRAFNLKGEDGVPWIEYLKVADGQFIEFFYAKPGFEGGHRRDANFAHLCLQVDNAQETVKQFQAAGVTIRSMPSVGKDTNTQFWVDDPDGNPIEFMEMNPASPQANA